MASVSVVMPCFNAERFLSRAIQSVLHQTYQDFEIIIVDDGSTDGSFRVISSFDDPRVRYIAQANGGPAKARNTGMRASSGEFVAFLDADDLMLPHRLAAQVDILKANPALSVVGSGYVWIDEKDREIFWPYHAWTRAMDLNNIASWLVDCPFVPSAVMLRRHAWEDVDGFDEDLIGPEDWNFWMRLVVTGHQMAWHQEVVCLYRRSASSLSEGARRMSAAGLEALQRILDRPDFPQDLLPLRNEALAWRHLDGAKRLYRSGMWEEGKAELALAISLKPDMIISQHGLPPLLEHEIVIAACDPLVKDRSAYLESVLANLPSNAGTVGADSRQFAPRIYEELFVRSFQEHHYRLAFGQHLPNLVLYPGWLLSRGLGMVRYCIRSLHHGVRSVSVRTLAKRAWRTARGRAAT